MCPVNSCTPRRVLLGSRSFLVEEERGHPTSSNREDEVSKTRGSVHEDSSRCVRRSRWASCSARPASRWRSRRPPSRCPAQPGVGAQPAQPGQPAPMPAATDQPVEAPPPVQPPPPTPADLSRAQLEQVRKEMMAMPKLLESHGYIRSGIGFNAKGGEQVAFRAPGAYSSTASVTRPRPTASSGSASTG